MKRSGLLITAAIISWVAWFAMLAAFLFLNDDRLLARVVFGTNIPAWRAAMDTLAVVFMALSLLALVFTIALMEAKPDANRD